MEPIFESSNVPDDAWNELGAEMENFGSQEWSEGLVESALCYAENRSSD